MISLCSRCFARSIKERSLRRSLASVLLRAMQERSLASVAKQAALRRNIASVYTVSSCFHCFMSDVKAQYPCPLLFQMINWMQLNFSIKFLSVSLGVARQHSCTLTNIPIDHPFRFVFLLERNPLYLLNTLIRSSRRSGFHHVTVI
jgi:hypothetical protein